MVKELCAVLCFQTYILMKQAGKRCGLRGCHGKRFQEDFNQRRNMNIAGV